MDFWGKVLCYVFLGRFNEISGLVVDYGGFELSFVGIEFIGGGWIDWSRISIFRLRILIGFVC